jgi:stage V sporulation protein D (sporulation-specific penicillin-binding protein)
VCAEVLEQTLVYKGIPRAATGNGTASASEDAAAQLIDILELPEDGDSADGT